MLTVAPLFCYHQIGHKEQAEKSVGKRKISAWHNKLCSTEMLLKHFYDDTPHYFLIPFENKQTNKQNQIGIVLYILPTTDTLLSQADPTG